MGASPVIDLNTQLVAQRRSFVHDGPPTLAQRQNDLKRLKQAILTHRATLEQAIEADFGRRPHTETALFEILPTLQGIEYLSRNLRRFMRPRRRRVALHFQPARAWVQYQPLGVIGIVSPWNYPLSLSLMPLATAIAAGNRVMLKPSELTPCTGALLAQLLRQLFPPEQVALIPGGPDIGAAFSALPFDHLLFTGSTTVGRQVMRAASDHLVPLTLELGGKSPALITPEFNLIRAARAIALGKLVNAGQTCIAPDYVLVPQDQIEDFVVAYRDAVTAAYPGGCADPAYASIISPRHHARLQALARDAADKGARVIEIGVSNSAAPVPASAPAAADSIHERCLAPTLILDATRDMAVLQEEIFGPVLPVIGYATLDEAIARVNAGPRPLALYVFSDRRGAIERILKHTTSGNVCINDTLLHYAQDDLPFGGVGASGMGAYHGEEGFRALSHAKGVFRQSRLNLSGAARAPFGALTRLTLRWLLR